MTHRERETLEVGTDPIDPSIEGFVSPAVERSWSPTDCILYALAVGAGGSDPTTELAFTTGDLAGVDQQVLPTFATVLGSSRPAMEAMRGVEPGRVVHASHAVVCHEPFAPEGRVTSSSAVEEVFDKGRAALVVIRTTSLDASGTSLFENVATMFVRGGGGFGGRRGPSSGGGVLPDRAPDAVVTAVTRPDQALRYRLTGDHNPLHVDPRVAGRAGFDRPILHGLCTYGFAGRALLHELCASDPAAFGSMAAHFTSPVVPGEALTTSIWRTGRGGRFCVEATGGRLVLERGEFTFRGAAA